MHDDVVFDPDSPDTRHVNTWLDRDYIPRHQGLLLSLGDSRILVYLQPESVPGAVHEIPIEVMCC